MNLRDYRRLRARETGDTGVTQLITNFNVLFLLGLLTFLIAKSIVTTWHCGRLYYMI